ncbi:MAG: hypothetical protein BMS9Abin29_1486 [Gemmatimonadota bacterium]|nr:MAG: hypothetical protein BMS9Abin29_1486 [Gemmatimonadota bacterium]
MSETWSPTGRYLAMDTSTPMGSVAVALGDEVLARRFLRTQGAHAANLIPEIEGVLADASVLLQELDGIVVGGGPGSFTGVRVAAATAKGLRRALDVPLWALSSLACGAASLGLRWVPGSDGPNLPLTDQDRTWPRYILLDARGGRVYAACYLETPQGLDVLVEPHSTTIDVILSGEIPYSVFAGDGADRHADQITGAGFPVLASPLGAPLADGLIRLLALAPETAPLENPSTWEPSYLRASGAERMARDG